MQRRIEYYFTVNSPWTYLGHGLLHEIAARHGASIVYKPVPLLEVFEATGSLPLPRRPPARQRYRFVEMQRWREKRGLALNLQPKHFPLDPAQINRMIIAAVAAGHDPAGFIGDALAAVWARDADMNDRATILELAARHGLDGEALMHEAKSDAVGAVFTRNGQEAIAADVFGAPGYVLDGEVFWGQDRLELLEDALSSGRAPFRTLS
jgi:2-hydroxychromene-2-carboxylate isomerase